MHLTSSELKAHATCLAALARAGHGTRTVDDVLGWVKAELEARGPGLASEEGSAPTSSSALSQEGPEEPTRPSVAPPQGPAPAQLFAKATHSSHLNYSDILQAFAATASGLDPESLADYLHNLAVLCHEAPDNELVVRPSVHSADPYGASGRAAPAQARGPAPPSRGHPLSSMLGSQPGVPPGPMYQPRPPGQPLPPRPPAHASLLDDGFRGHIVQPLRSSSDPLRLLSALEELERRESGHGPLALGGGLHLGELPWEEAPPALPSLAAHLLPSEGQGLLKTSSAPEHMLRGALAADSQAPTLAEEWEGLGASAGLDRRGSSSSIFSAPPAAREQGATAKPSGLWPGARTFVQRRASRLSTHCMPAEEQ